MTTPITPEELDELRSWTVNAREYGHCGEGEFERRQRARHNDRLELIGRLIADNRRLAQELAEMKGEKL